MDGTFIIARVADFIRACARGEERLTDDQVDRFGEMAKEAIRKHFGKTPADASEPQRTIRASTLGRPICQQQMQQIGAPSADPSPFEYFKLAYGDIVEGLATVIMEGAALPIEAMQCPVSLALSSGTFTGTYDFRIDGQIYDFKTASQWSFKHKFQEDGLGDEIRDTGSDELGYGIQGQFYQNASGYPFAGWIVVDKSSGEWTFAPISLVSDNENLERRAAALVASREAIVENGLPAPDDRTNVNSYNIKRVFSPVEETFRKKPTGNMLLPSGCTFCKFKRSCWDKLEYRRAIKSEAKNPALKYYVEVKEEYGQEEVTGASAGLLPD
jgi:hypothetical protein